MGLHLNAHAHIQDPLAREHRNRVWWTVYIFDHMWSAKLGLPNSLHDEDILVDMPSPMGEQDHKEDFIGDDHLVANVELARLAGDIITSIYGRRRQAEPFSSRVQHALRDLQAWAGSLPGPLQMKVDQPLWSIGWPAALHLNFNQVRVDRFYSLMTCIIVLTVVVPDCHLNDQASAPTSLPRPAGPNHWRH
jgi:hypothetical protein